VQSAERFQKKRLLHKMSPVINMSNSLYHQNLHMWFVH